MEQRSALAAAAVGGGGGDGDDGAVNGGIYLASVFVACHNRERKRVNVLAHDTTTLTYVYIRVLCSPPSPPSPSSPSSPSQVKSGDVIACAGFGAGLSWGAAVIRWSG